MAIYTRFSSQVTTIIGYTGFRAGTTGFGQEVWGEWVTVQFADRPIGLRPTRDILTSDLRADGGWAEISTAIDDIQRNWEADGTCSYMVENRRRVQPGEDWLEVIRRPCRGTTMQPHEDWTAVLLNMQGRYAEADAAREHKARQRAWLEADPLNATRLGILEAKASIPSRDDSRLRDAGIAERIEKAKY